MSCKRPHDKRGLVAVVTGGLLVAGGLGIVVAHRPSAGAVERTLTLPSQGGSVTLDVPDHRALVVGVTPGMTGYASTLDTLTGRLVRSVVIGSNPADVAVDARTKRAFIADMADGTVRTLDVRVVRTVAVGDLQPHDLQRLVVDTRTDHVFVSSSPVSVPNPALSAVHMLDARSGAVLHTTLAGGGSLGVDSPTGRVYAADLADSSISVLDGRTGMRVQTLALSPYTRALHLAVDGRTGRVVVATDVGSLQVFDTRTGRLLRSLAQSGVRNALLAVDEARGRIVSIDGQAAPPYALSVRVLDTHSGATVHATMVRDAYPLALDGQRGRVIVGATSGMSAFDVRTGAALWTYTGSLQTLGDIAVDEQTGRVFVVDRGAVDPSGIHHGPGSVIVLDGRTGVLRGSIPAGVYPRALAIDAATAHAIVVNDGGLVPVNDAWSWLPAWLRNGLPIVRSPRTRLVGGSVSLLDTAH